jgi:hypothetical protein
MVWLAKGVVDPPLMILHAFCRQKVSVALRCVVIIDESSSSLTILRFPFPFLLCFLQLVGALEHNLFI